MGFKGKSISVANYDAGNRLTYWNRAGSDENHSQTWNYDDAGNWNSTTKDGDTKSRDHSVSDQITQLDGNPVIHDLKGNLTKYKYGRKNYKVKYDLDNRIFSVKSNRRKVTYRYDALGRRIISKKNGNRTALIWWGDSECVEYKHKNRQRVVQHDIMGHPTRLNSVIARDTARGKRKVKLQWYHKNYLDHVYAVSDDNGNLVEHYRYTAFGEVEIYSPTGQKLAVSAIDNTVMWNSRRFDADTGLYYYKYRHYKSDIGRWLGRDPIEEDGGINLYAFVGNEPVGRFDRLGLELTKATVPKPKKVSKLTYSGAPASTANNWNPAPILTGKDGCKLKITGKLVLRIEYLKASDLKKTLKQLNSGVRGPYANNTLEDFEKLRARVNATQWNLAAKETKPLEKTYKTKAEALAAQQRAKDIIIAREQIAIAQNGAMTAATYGHQWGVNVPESLKKAKMMIQEAEATLKLKK